MVLFCLRLVRGFWKIYPDLPLKSRLLASPADAGETPTLQKKRAQTALIFVGLGHMNGALSSLSSGMIATHSSEHHSRS